MHKIHILKCIDSHMCLVHAPPYVSHTPKHLGKTGRQPHTGFLVPALPAGHLQRREEERERGGERGPDHNKMSRLFLNHHDIVISTLSFAIIQLIQPAMLSFIVLQHHI